MKIKNLPKLVPSVKVSPFDVELNSECNGLVFMDGTYFLKKLLVENLFRRGSFSSMKMVSIFSCVLLKRILYFILLFKNRRNKN